VSVSVRSRWSRVRRVRDRSQLARHILHLARSLQQRQALALLRLDAMTVAPVVAAVKIVARAGGRRANEA
jgi:hypothetical protein